MFGDLSLLSKMDVFFIGMIAGWAIETGLIFAFSLAFRSKSWKKDPDLDADGSYACDGGVQDGELKPVQKEEEINDDFIHNKFGYCYFEVEPGKRPIIFNLFVNQQYRRQGHAKWLLTYVINEIRKTGYMGEINIEAAPRENSIDREKLTEFYAGMGLNVLQSSKENGE